MQTDVTAVRCHSRSARHSNSRPSKSARHAKSFRCKALDDFDDYDAPSLGYGGSAAVLAVNAQLVVKLFPISPKAGKELMRELDVYQRLTRDKQSPYVMQCFGRWETGVVLERLEMTIRQRLQGGEVSPQLQDLWIIEIARGVSFLHRNRIHHGDISCQNMMLDRNDNAKICDFAGSRMGKKEGSARYQVRNQHPGYIGHQPNATTEIFALGSVFFEIVTGRPPYEYLPESSIQQKYAEGDFPLDFIIRPEMQAVIGACWRGEYRKVSHLCEDIELYVENGI